MTQLKFSSSKLVECKCRLDYKVNATLDFPHASCLLYRKRHKYYCKKICENLMRKSINTLHARMQLDNVYMKTILSCFLCCLSLPPCVLIVLVVLVESSRFDQWVGLLPVFLSRFLLAFGNPSGLAWLLSLLRILLGSV